MRPFLFVFAVVAAVSLIPACFSRAQPVVTTDGGRTYELFVDPHPSTPADPVTGKTPPYTGPPRGPQYPLPDCDYFDAGAVHALMRERPNFVLPMPVLRFRTDLPHVANCERKTRGADVGAGNGAWAKVQLQRWTACEEYVLVDVFPAATLGDALRSTSTWQEKVKMCRNTSTACAEAFPDGVFDYVYLHAHHDRLGTLEDLEAWWPKLRKGGFIAGADYVVAAQMQAQNVDYWTINYDGSRDQTGRSVRGAVDDFFMSPEAMETDHFRQVVPCYREFQQPCWAVRK